MSNQGSDIKLTNVLTGHISMVVCGEYDPKNLPRKGTKYIFRYPKQFVTLPDYTAHANQEVTVLRRLKEHGPSAENETGVPMFKVVANDGWQGDAWADELEELNASKFK
jgi:hypothetical protein